MKSLPTQSRPKPVLDTSPAIGLSKIGRFGLLQRLFGEVVVTEAVYKELLAKGDSPGALEVTKAIEAGWVEVVAVEASPNFLELGRWRSRNIDAGEQNLRIGPSRRSGRPFAWLSASAAYLGNRRRTDRCETQRLRGAD